MHNLKTRPYVVVVVVFIRHKQETKYDNETKISVSSTKKKYVEI